MVPGQMRYVRQYPNTCRELTAKVKIGQSHTLGICVHYHKVYVAVESSWLDSGELLKVRVVENQIGDSQSFGFLTLGQDSSTRLNDPLSTMRGMLNRGRLTV